MLGILVARRDQPAGSARVAPQDGHDVGWLCTSALAISTPVLLDAPLFVVPTVGCEIGHRPMSEPDSVILLARIRDGNRPGVALGRDRRGGLPHLHQAESRYRPVLVDRLIQRGTRDRQPGPRLEQAEQLRRSVAHGLNR